jgi:hypothetical protein
MADVVRTWVPAESVEEQWDIPALERALADEWQVPVALAAAVEKSDTITDEDIVDKVVVAADQVFEGKLAVVGQEPPPPHAWSMAASSRLMSLPVAQATRPPRMSTSRVGSRVPMPPRRPTWSAVPWLVLA